MAETARIPLPDDELHSDAMRPLIESTSIQNTSVVSAEFLIRQAEAGLAAAQYALAKYYLSGRLEPEIPQDFKKAYDLLMVVSRKTDHSGALNALGYMHYHGFLGEPDYSRARGYWERAEQRGSVRASLNLGICYSLGHSVDRDPKLAREYFEQAQNQGDREAAYHLGVLHHSEQEFQTAKLYWEEAASLGSQRALVNLGIMYAAGEGVEIDNDKAREFFEACPDDPRAHYGLGLAYIRGLGVEPSVERGLEYLRKSAEANDPFGLAALGSAYYDGKLVEKDESFAVECLSKAVALGHPQAKQFLAHMGYYEVGLAEEDENILGLVEKPEAARNLEGVTKERSYPMSEESKLDNAELAPIFEGELDRDAMAEALSAAMKEQGLSVRKTAAAASVGTNDIQRIGKGTATLDKAAEVLSNLGYELHVEVRKAELP